MKRVSKKSFLFWFEIFQLNFGFFLVSEEFRKLFDKYCLRRNKKILKDVPACSEVILYHGITKLQYDMYRAILCNNRGG